METSDQAITLGDFFCFSRNESKRERVVIPFKVQYRSWKSIKTADIVYALHSLIY